MIRTLIVEDSPVAQQLLTHILASDPRIQVVGIADNGEKAIACVERLRPDVVTMDIHMPGLNGFDATRRIMEDNPVPIVIVSGSFSANHTGKGFRAMEAGALTILRKPRGIGHPEHGSDAKELIRTVVTMAGVKVIRRWPRRRREVFPAALPAAVVRPGLIRMVAIGASTGGPAVLQRIFAALPKALPVPLVVVQHMAVGFMESFVTWLSASSGFPSRVAIHGEPLVPGQAYFAPDGSHLLVRGDNRIALAAKGSENGLCPSVNRLFRSVTEAHGRNAVGVLLTGMGKDGADGLMQMKERGAMTVVQDQESSIVFGMPGEAVKLGAAEYILAPDRIAELLTQVVQPATR
jgi:two-component system chemotaxis response regulator CheB